MKRILRWVLMGGGCLAGCATPEAPQRYAWIQDKLITWATYEGFMPGRGEGKSWHPYMGCPRPAIFDKLPAGALCQWTLTFMIHQKRLPLSAYLDNGTPAEALSCDTWPPGVKPLSPRSVGFMHQGSQLYGYSRYKCVISEIKEACLRA